MKKGFRIWLSKTVRKVLHLHYDVKIEGAELMRDDNIHLLLPNHPAYIEPVILFSELWDVNLRPLCDEYLFRRPFSGFAMRLVNAIVVPDLPATSASGREQAAEKARALTNIAINSLNGKAESANSSLDAQSEKGENIVFYPSGHIKLTPKEQIGNRRLAYEVCSDLPEGVRVIMLRTTGLDGSLTSKLPTKPTLRRKVKMHFEDMTDQILKWTTSTPITGEDSAYSQNSVSAPLDRRTFNAKLEEWYNTTENF